MHVCKRNPSEDTSCPLGNLGKISRNCNSVAHDLCQMARRDVCGGLLQIAVLTCALRSTLNDCDPNNVV
jgi:hypothetical protein